MTPASSRKLRCNCFSGDTPVPGWVGVSEPNWRDQITPAILGVPTLTDRR